LEVGYDCSSGVCECETNYYEESNECYICNSVCGSCTGPDETDCLTCAENYKMVIPSDNVSGAFQCIESISDCPVDYKDTGSTCTQCGNGIIDDGEECDDDNLSNGDGCNDQCEIEVGYVCPSSGDTDEGDACRCAE
jgi:cysteine-rich repeat protein